MQAQIRVDRQKAEEERRRQIEKGIEYAIAGFLILVVTAMVVAGGVLIYEYKT